jgi:hypothetical protein
MADANIEVDMIVQSVSAREGLTNFAFTVNKVILQKQESCSKKLVMRLVRWACKQMKK